MTIYESVRSLTPGRARLRHEALRGLAAAEVESLVETVRSMDGITGVTINPRVGSLLVTWDTEKVDAQTLLEAAEWFLASREAFASTEAAEASSAASSALADGASTEASCKASCGCGCASALKAGGELLERVERVIEPAGGRILDGLSPFLAPDVKKGGRARRVTQNRLMLAGFAGSLAALAVRGTAAHVVLGGVFTALLTVHLWQHRRVL